MIKYFFLIFYQLISFRPDAVYFTLSPAGPAFFRDIIYVFLFKIFRTKIIFHLHGKGISQTIRKNKLCFKLGAWVFNNSNTISLSHMLLQDLEGLKIRKRYVVYNGLPDLYNGNQREPNSVTNLLYLSNYVKSKGVLDLIHALKIVKERGYNFKASLVGREYDLTVSYLLRQVQELDLQDLVEVTGPKYGEQKLSVLQQTDIFVFPTYYPNEAFPLVLLEAMQFGIPLISTKEGGIPEIISEGKNGFVVNQRDIVGLADKICLLIEFPEVRASLGTNAREIYLEKFSFSSYQKNILLVIDEVSNS